MSIHELMGSGRNWVLCGDEWSVGDIACPLYRRPSSPWALHSPVNLRRGTGEQTVACAATYARECLKALRVAARLLLRPSRQLGKDERSSGTMSTKTLFFTLPVEVCAWMQRQKDCENKLNILMPPMLGEKTSKLGEYAVGRLDFHAEYWCWALKHQQTGAF